MTPHGWVGFRVVNAGTERGLPGKLSECRSVSLSELTAPNAAKSCERPGSQLTFRTGHMGYTFRFSQPGVGFARPRSTSMRPCVAARSRLRVELTPAARADGSLHHPAGARRLKLLAACTTLVPIRRTFV
jgi:hypothetical protein